MTDGDLEHLLQRYEPAAPPASLRARVLRPRVGRAWPWAVAAAALLAVTVWLQLSAASLLVDTAVAVQPDVPSDEIEALATLLGDERDARDEARRLIERRDIDRALDAAAVGTTGASR